MRRVTARKERLAMIAPLLALVLLAPSATLDAGDDEYHFVVGLYDKGMHALVVEEATQFLDRFPAHAQAPLARYRLGLSLFELERLDEAAQHFAALARRDAFEYTAESWLRLGQCQLAADELAPAQRSFEAVLSSDADYLRAPATFLLGEARFRAGDVAGAAESYRATLESGAESAGHVPRALCGLAWCAYRTGDAAAGLEHARRFLRRHADHPLAGEVHFLEGEALLELGRAREALEAFERAGEGAHADGALRGRGFALAALGQPEEAARIFGELVARFPDSPYAPEAALQRGVQLLESGDAAAARESLASPRVPDDAEALFWRAWAESRDGDPEAARASLDAALDHRPDGELRARIQSLLGDVLQELGRESDAVAAYRDSGSDYSLHAASVASLNAGRTDDATRLARALLDEHPQSAYRPDALLTLGEGLFRQERWSEAEDAFARAAEQAQGDEARARCASRLAWCRYLAGDLAEAAERFEAVSREHAQSPHAEEAAFLAARARLEAGEPDPARHAFARYLERFPDGERADLALLELARLEGADGAGAYERLLSRHPESPAAPEARYELAELLAGAGRADEAQRHYAELLERHGDHDLAGPALYGLAWARYESGDAAGAVEALRAFQRRGRVPEELVVSGLELLVFSECGAGRPREALAAYERFADRCEDDERVFVLARTLAEALRDAGEVERAHEVLEDCLARTRDEGVLAGALVEGVYLSLERADVADAEARALVAQRRAPDDPAVAEALFFVGEAHFAEGRDDRAAELYLRAAAVPACPVADSALYKAGFAQLRTGDAAGAAQVFESLVEDHAESPLVGESLFLAGEARFRLDELERALGHFTALRERAPRHEVLPKALFRGGVALCRLERWDEAGRWLAHLVQRHPEFENAVEADLWRGRALARSGDARGARQAFERVAARDRGVLAARARLELGHLRLEADDLEGALSEYLKVAVLFAGSEEVAEGLWMAGQCLERLGDPDRARTQYEEVLSDHGGTPFAALARERLQRLH